MVGNVGAEEIGSYESTGKAMTNHTNTVRKNTYATGKRNFGTSNDI